VAHYPGADLDELLAQGGERPMLNLSRARAKDDRMCPIILLAQGRSGKGDGRPTSTGVQRPMLFRGCELVITLVSSRRLQPRRWPHAGRHHPDALGRRAAAS
jgi:hypothetical protein